MSDSTAMPEIQVMPQLVHEHPSLLLHPAPSSRTFKGNQYVVSEGFGLAYRPRCVIVREQDVVE